ncbi:UNVERIFIED_CONTAM: hypothetical protein K2H54_074587 [Gekko kuhli]
MSWIHITIETVTVCVFVKTGLHSHSKSCIGIKNEDFDIEVTSIGDQMSLMIAKERRIVDFESTLVSGAVVRSTQCIVSNPESEILIGSWSQVPWERQ